MSGWVYGPGGSTSPGGSNGDIQFNSSGSFSGSALLTTDGAGSLSASANISASAFYGDGSNLTNVTASAVEVADGPQYSLQFRFDSPVSGDLSGSSDLLWDPATGDVLISGSVRLQDGEEFYGDLEGAILFPAKVDEVGGIGKGKVVYIKGLSGTTPTIGLAACDDPATMPAFGLCAVSASNNANTQVATFGSLDGLNLNNISPGHSFSEGDILYVNTGSGGTAGTFTNVKPTGSSNLVQNIGKVVRNGVSSNGQIKVGGAGRANDTPNLDKGHIFVGNDTDQAIQDNTIFVSASAERVGINVSTNLTAALHVSASSVHGGESARFEGEVVITSPEGKLEVQDTTNNYQVTLVPAAIPRVAFGTTTDDAQYMVIDGGNTNRIVALNDFYIGTASVNSVNFGKGFYYDISEERFGIHTNAPTHDFTVDGDISASANVSASAFYFGPGGRQVISDTGTDMSILATSTGMFISADGGNLTLQNNVAIDTAGVISSSQNISGSGLYAEDVYISSIPDVNRVLVSTTDGQITSHSPFTFASDVLFVPAITASVGISSSILILDPTSGSLAGDGSYLGLNANNQIIVTSSAGGGGTPGGADTQVQFNDGGSFGGDSTLTFNKTTDVLSVSTITASVGVEVTSSANGSINIGEGIRYTFNGNDRLDAFESEFKLRDINYYKAISTVQTSNFNIENFQTFLVNTSGSVVTGTLPGLTSDDQIGLTYTIKDFAGSGSTNNVVVEPSGSQEIDSGTAAKIQTNFGALTLTALSSSDGYTWGIVSAT